ncbi:protein disulfide-isomerase TMX3-like isoform X2 [Simochromis diagramma]|uniref:protein disulfide-isomerase TMX3-like isoform X2 n=1 Tax=Simochromis diagramma TaxID=43689 RepID=UPI001A7E5443|nr:protein disulfide-isomerase TMX3-like isoform X2 [Simochromis diagramma]
MPDRRTTVLLSVLLFASAAAFVEELDDSFMETKGDDEIWLIKFYAPWCTFCKQLDPVWHQIGSEYRSLGSPVHVGKSDATANTGLAKEFRVRTYPAILMLKKNIKYNYSGVRTKDGIMDFANRIAGPLVRSLSSVQLFQHAMSRHDVMFVYVGATSPLKAVSLSTLPAVVVFKDGTYFTYSEERDGDLKLWINRERFPNFSQIDSYTLYAMGETGKLVLLALVEEKHLCEESLRYKSLLESVAAEHREIYSREMYFGFMAGSDYISGLVMGEIIVPTFIVVNLSNDGYFLPPGTVQTEQNLLDFLDGVLNGSVQGHGGNGALQRVRRLVYDTRVTLAPVFSHAPLLGCFLVAFPLTIGACFCYLCFKARPTVVDEDGTPLLAPPLGGHKKSKKKSD